MKQPSQGLPQPSSHSSGSALSQECYSALYGAPGTPSALCSSSPAAAFFSDLDEGVLSRADNMGLLEMDKDASTTHQLLKPHDFYRHTSSFTLAGQDGTPMTQLPALTNHFVLGSESDLTFETLASNSSPGMCAGTSAIDYHRYLPQNMAIASSAAHDLTGYSAEGHGQIYSSMYSSSPHPVVVSSHQHLPPSHPPNAHLYSAHPAHHSQQSQDLYKNDCDPLELERFAEMFKQRRIKLGVTQADVGSALAELRIPGVGSLSQSTICRFESLTLSHNNMIALKPILLTWLEEAEQRAYERRAQQQQQQLEEKKRKRTSITAPEKRSLEAYFAVQPRPSGDKIAQIAEKLDLRKNVVRVWFCNQRQKQKRLKFSATAVGHH